MTLPPVGLFVIGAQKCATSWLYLCLRDHPQLLLPDKKDEANYYGGARHRERGPGWFDGLYPPSGHAQMRASVSVDYLYDKAALERVLRDHPQARFVACLREPTGRAMSAIGYLQRKGMLPVESPEQALERALGANAAGDMTQHAELIGRGLYAAQLQPFVDADALDRLLLLGFEELRRRPAASLQTLFAFAGIDPAFIPPSFDRRPKRSANLSILTRLERLAPQSRVMGRIMDRTNQWLCDVGLARERPALPAVLEQRLRAAFAPDVAALDRLLARMPPGRALFQRGAAADWNLT